MEEQPALFAQFPTAYYRLGICFYYQKEYVKAIECYEKDKAKGEFGAELAVEVEIMNKAEQDYFHAISVAQKNLWRVPIFPKKNSATRSHEYTRARSRNDWYSTHVSQHRPTTRTRRLMIPSNGPVEFFFVRPLT